MDSDELDQDYKAWKYYDYEAARRQDELWRQQHPWTTVLVRLGTVAVAVLFWIWFFKRVL